MTLLYAVFGLILIVVPGGPGPQNPGLERPDAERRGRVDPAHPPPGYYETHDRRPLRGHIRLTSSGRQVCLAEARFD
jgi:hypothetical protein